MKSGEKVVFRAVIASVIAIAALTVYLEMQHQKRSARNASSPPRKTADQLVSGAKPDVLVIPKGMNPDDLPNADSRGATLLTLYCMQCHDLPTPAMHTASEWPDIVSRMQGYLKANLGGMLSRAMMPPKKDWMTLANYLNENAQTPIHVADFTDINTAEAKAFLSACSQCHQAPAPESHTQSEWPRVVLRMQANSLSAKRQAPDPQTRSQIISFLQRHSKNEHQLQK